MVSILILDYYLPSACEFNTFTLCFVQAGGYDDNYGEGYDLTYGEGYGEGYGDYTEGGGGSSSSTSVSVGGGSVSVGGGSVSSSGSVAGGGSTSAGASAGAGSVATGAGQGGIGGESVDIDKFKEESITDYTDSELEKIYDYDTLYTDGEKALPAETDESYGQVVISFPP